MGQSTWGERMKFTIRMNSISLLVVLLTVAAGFAEDEVARKPKLFFVSTSATTTTLQTLSVCHYTSGSLTTCTGRRRRAIDVEGVMLSDVKSLEDSTELESSHREEGTSIMVQGMGGSCFTGSPPLPSPPPPPSPPHTP